MKCQAPLCGCCCFPVHSKSCQKSCRQIATPPCACACRTSFLLLPLPNTGANWYSQYTPYHEASLPNTLRQTSAPPSCPFFPVLTYTLHSRHNCTSCSTHCSDPIWGCSSPTLFMAHSFTSSKSYLILPLIREIFP